MLQKIGFSEYEAKIYLSLLETPALNGTQLSKILDMPRTTVYNALTSLCERKIINLIPSDSDKKNYIPVAPDILISKIQNEYKQIFENIVFLLEKIYNPNKFYEIYNIFGLENIYDKINDMIVNAKQSIVIMGNIDDNKLKQTQIKPIWSSSEYTIVLVDDKSILIANLDDKIANAIYTQNKLIIGGYYEKNS